ncbi:phage tail tape measure protein [Ponticoccus litoralis]|uniref:Phage tail tape measure protein n=1 Tax=Ponticoccus litoralis TaxID=422297 RepID=A0AAW9S7Q6_9RHOB
MDIARLGIQIDSRGARSAVTDLDKLDKSAGRAERAAGGLGKAFGMAFAGIAGALASVNAVSTLRGFESAMAEVGAVSQASADQMQAMRDMAQEMGATTKFSATDAANALAQLTASGYSADDSMKALSGTMNLAAVGSMSLEQAADSTSDILQQFRLGVEETNRVVDVLAKQHTQSSSSVAMTAAAMQQAGVAAATLGLDVETTAAAIGALAESGIKGAQGGTALNAVLSRLIDPTKDARGALAEFGLTADDMDIASRGLLPVLRDLEAANIDLATANALVGLEHGKSLISLANSVDMLGDFTEANRDASGEALRLAKYMSDNLDGAFLGLRSAAEGLILALGEAGLTEAIKSSVEAVTALVRGVTAMPNLGPIAAGFTAVAAGAVLLASPLIAGAAAVTGLAAAGAHLYQNWDRVAAAFPRAAGFVSAAVDGLMNGLAYVYRRARQAMAGIEAALNGDGGAALGALFWEMVGDAEAALRSLSPAVSDAVDAWKRYISAGVQTVQAILSGDWVGAWEGAKATVYEFGDFWNSFVISPISQAPWMQELLNSAPMQSALEMLGGYFESFSSGLSAAWVNIQDAWAQVGPTFDHLRSIIGSLMQIFSDADSDAALSDLASGLGRLTGLGLEAVSLGLELFARAIETVTGALAAALKGDWSQFFNEFREFFSWLGGGVLEAVKVAMDGMGSAISGAGTVIAGAFADIWAAIKAEVASWPGQMIAMGEDLVQGLIDGIKAKAAGVTGAIGDMASDAITSAKSLLGIQSPSKVFREIGEWTGQGFIDGVSGKVADANDVIAQLTGGADTSGALAGMSKAQKKSAAESWVTRAMSDIDRYKAQLAELAELNNAGFFASAPEAYADAVKMVADQLDRAEGAKGLSDAIEVSKGELASLGRSLMHGDWEGALDQFASTFLSRIYDIAMDPIWETLANALNSLLGGIFPSVGAVSTSGYSASPSALASVGLYAEGGELPRRAKGGGFRDVPRAIGKLAGPGGKTEDNLLFWGSRGEFMQPAAAVDYYGLDFMEAIQKRKIPKFAAGGVLGARSSSVNSVSASAVQPIVNMQVNVEPLPGETAEVTRPQDGHMNIRMVRQVMRNELASGSMDSAMRQRWGGRPLPKGS